MEKKIVLKMQLNKDINISINEGKSIVIPKNNRIIKADDLFDLLDFSRGDKYNVEVENEENLDGPVLLFFEKLITDITKKLNKIPKSSEDEFLEHQENINVTN